jgi:2-dehydropantoate 2-reductase
MKVCIIGAGAVGGMIGARLAANTKSEVSALARGDTLKALNANGWRLKQGDTTVNGPAKASAKAGDLGPQDLVIIAVKAPAMPDVAAAIGPLLKPETMVLPAMNGVPWWFSHGITGLGEAPLQSVDPGGAIDKAIPLKHVIGCVVHLSAATTEPGLVLHRGGNGLIIGEPDGSNSPRLKRVHDLISEAKFEVTSSPAIRHDIWYKLWGNMTMNPVSAITGATGDRMLDDDLVRNFCSAAMVEAAAIGARIGCVIDQDPEARHDLTRKLGAFKTSMLVDAERGKPIELDALVTSVHELGKRTGVPTPYIDGLLGITRLFAQTHKLI